jgi:hypothetical protein
MRTRPGPDRHDAVMQRLADRPLGRFARPRRRLRAGLVQLLCALAGLGLGLLLPRITFDSTVASSRVTDALVAVGFGVLGLVTIIFSLLFLVAAPWAPRKLVSIANVRMIRTNAIPEARVQTATSPG